LSINLTLKKLMEFYFFARIAKPCAKLMQFLFHI